MDDWNKYTSENFIVGMEGWGGSASASTTSGAYGSCSINKNYDANVGMITISSSAHVHASSPYTDGSTNYYYPVTHVTFVP